MCVCVCVCLCRCVCVCVCVCVYKSARESPSLVQMVKRNVIENIVPTVVSAKHLVSC